MLTDPAPNPATSTRTETTPTAPRLRWLGPLTTAWSALIAAIGALWLLAPSTIPDSIRADEADGSLIALLPAPIVSWSMILAGVCGVVLAALASRTAGPRDHGSSSGRRAGLAAVAAGYAIVFGLLAPDLSLLVGMGYLSALLGPPLLLVLLSFVALRSRPARVLLAAVFATVAIALTGWGMDWSSLAAFGHNLGAGLARGGPAILVALTAFAGGALWLLTLLRLVGAVGSSGAVSTAGWDSAGRPGSATQHNWRRPHGWGLWVTIGAALCPLPYVLLRLTWLTPWPTLMDHAELVADPALRVFGLSLGLAAAAGSVLTIGLVSRWGEVYPRWIPVLGGRTVSRTWPTVTALVVAGAITVAGRSVVQMLITEPNTELLSVEMLVILPFPLWGPLLAAAAVAYFLRRARSR